MTQKTAFAVFLSVGILQGCGPGQGNVEYEHTMDFWSEKGPEVIRELEKEYKKTNFKYLFHIHFAGNDFGAGEGMENEIDLKAGSLFERNQLSREDAALNFRTDFKDPHILGSIAYRHLSKERANHALKYLFRCENGKSDLIDQTFILGSGGSHGVDELQNFAKQLEKDCGKKLDFALIADGIAKPGPLPIVHFRGLNEKASCVQYWQRYPKGALKGSKVNECFNVKVSDVDHWGLSAYPLHLVRSVLDQIDMTAPHFGVTNFTTSIAQNVETEILLEKIESLQKENDRLKQNGRICE